MRILVVDDEKIKRVTLADDLAAQGHDVVAAVDGEQALQRLRAGPFDVVITDLKMPGLDGLELLTRIKQGPTASIEVIIMTAYGSIPVAVEAVKLGAMDFLTKPFRNEDVFPLLARIERHRQKASGRTVSPSEAIERQIVGRSAAMGRVKHMVGICARTDANVLLCSETGCGKDLVASTIHRNSHRHGFPFVKVGCALFPPNLIESELYGHEKGSFTGADQQRQGRFALAEGGTLYLDDVDDIPLEQQPKLLRAIEEKVYERVGGTDQINADVRIVASTKRNLVEKIGEGSFREDLYYRLDVLRINIPPLRARLEDVPLLVEHLLKRIVKGEPAEIEPEALQMLQRHSWPGNVRELYHTLERAYLIAGGSITAAVLREQLGHVAVPAGPPTAGGPAFRPAEGLPAEGFHATMQQTERELLENALKTAAGNKTAAAAALGMKPSTFRDRLAKHGLG
ncbi:MAG: sigma-54-dependent transcriptional regulator [Pirellulales bacterium]